MLGPGLLNLRLVAELPPLSLGRGCFLHDGAPMAATFRVALNGAAFRAANAWLSGHPTQELPEMARNIGVADHASVQTKHLWEQ